jgi:ribosomal protein S18 acetylase RimI-like enzyme
MDIKIITPADFDSVVAIAQALPEWFDDSARNHQIPIDVKHHDGFIAFINGIPVGFVTLYVAQGRLNISWMGVLISNQRHNIGGTLLRAVEDQAKAMGITEIGTYTLGDNVDYAPYQRTRSFYYKNGFCVYKRSTTDNPGCPEEIWLSKKVQDNQDK